jgi:hypothetical protein
MGLMAALDAASEPDSVRNPQVCACYVDQELLSRQLSNHEDPHVRIIAHMSNRQLAMAEQMSDLTRGIFKASGGVANLQEQMKDVRADLRANTFAVEQVTAALSSVVSSIDKLTKAVEAIGVKQADLESRLYTLESSAGVSASI